MPRAKQPVVLITGVSGGIGLATAKEFGRRGWIVVGTVRKRARLAALRSSGIDVQPAEMARQGDLSRLMDHIWRTYGRLDAVILNAGYGLIGPLDTLDYAGMWDQLTVNALAPAELIRLALPGMIKRGSGAIIAVSSLAGIAGVPGFSMYSASKFALEGLIESLELEYADRGIRFALVEPSGVNTPFWKSTQRGRGRKWADGELPSRLGGELTRSTMGLTPETVAAVIYEAVTTAKPRLRYPLGQTKRLLLARRFLPESLYRRLWRRVMM